MGTIGHYLFSDFPGSSLYLFGVRVDLPAYEAVLLVFLASSIGLDIRCGWTKQAGTPEATSLNRHGQRWENPEKSRASFLPHWENRGPE